MRLAYLDCFSGISGDMALGALVHAGADLDRIGEALDDLPIEGFLLEREEVEDHGIVATRMHVKTRPQGLIRTYASIRPMLEASDLPPSVRRTAGRIFHRLATGMGRVHGKEPELVTFHELGEVEVVVEIVGVALALELLGVERIFASPIPTGMGMAHHEHGLVPIPSPEVSELLQTVPTYTRGTPMELVTPVGAAIVAAVVEGFGDMPVMRAEHVGYGAGHPRPDFPNLLRVVVGEEEPAWRRAEAPVPPGEGRFDRDPRVRLAAVPESPASGWADADPAPAAAVLVEAVTPVAGDQDGAEPVELLIDAGASEAWAARILLRGGATGLRLSAACPNETAAASVRAAMEAMPGTTIVHVGAVSSTQI